MDSIGGVKSKYNDILVTRRNERLNSSQIESITESGWSMLLKTSVIEDQKEST